jgi:hypothetical protein
MNEERLDALLGFPVFHLVLGFFFADPVLFLDLSDELIAFTLDLIDFVVGKLAPFFFYLAFELFPVAFGLIPVHVLPPLAYSIGKLQWCNERTNFYFGA